MRVDEEEEEEEEEEEDACAAFCAFTTRAATAEATGCRTGTMATSTAGNLSPSTTSADSFPGNRRRALTPTISMVLAQLQRSGDGGEEGEEKERLTVGPS
jgi:hypothetical protein